MYCKLAIIAARAAACFSASPFVPQYRRHLARNLAQNLQLQLFASAHRHLNGLS